MFEKEIKFIGDFCFNQVKGLGSNFTLDKITIAGVHPAVVQYISAELDFMIYSDRRKLLQQSYFDYAGKEISDHFQKISGEIKKHKKISIEDSKKLIFQAVSFNINYLVRPRWSLIKLIFNDQPVISVEEMKMMLNYLYYYEYFKKVLIGYISKRNLIQISSTEFDILLNKIDNELINSNQHQVISNSFTSMGDFFNIGGVDKNRLPLPAVEIFCKEKNLVDLILKLRKVIPNEVKRRYDKIEIERILFSSDTIEELEKDNDVETETDTEKMIEALDADESDIEESEKNSLDESEKSDTETFLSPEEEEALLSLYSEESIENKKNSDDILKSSESDIRIDDFKESYNQGVKTALTEILEPIDEDLEEVGENTYSIDTADSNEIEVESLDIYEENSSENLISSDEELDGIVDAITEDLPEAEIEVDENLRVDIDEVIDSEVENLSGEFDSNLPNSGIEKEIVQEMIEDYYGEEKNDDAKQDHEFEPEEIAEIFSDSTEKNNLVADEEKISSLEDDLLNIFEGLDKEDFILPEKERFSVDTPDPSMLDLQEEKVEAQISSEATDGFDEYLKSIDEIIFTEKPTIKVEEKKQVEVEVKIESPANKIVEAKEQPSTVPTNAKNEKVSNKTRTLRQKDLFSYLKRKEVKKIVSFIFANDEEDFTNTVERIMDCHSYKEASEILKAVFTSYKISPYSKEAITYTNAVSNYFRQA